MTLKQVLHILCFVRLVETVRRPWPAKLFNVGPLTLGTPQNPLFSLFFTPQGDRSSMDVLI